MSKPKYYERLVLAREYIRYSEMLRVDPTDNANTTPETLDEFRDIWGTYYAIYEANEYDDGYELVADGDDYEEIRFDYIDRLYNLYVADCGDHEPLRKSDWCEHQLPAILDKIFPTRVKDKK